MNRLILLCAASAISVGCSGGAPPQTERVDTTSSALVVAPTTTFLPLPVLVDDNEEPVVDPSGNHVAGWDGSTAELMAADALGQCMLSSAYFSSQLSTRSRGLDEFLFSLRAHMATTTCHIVGESLYPVAGAAGGDIIERWFIGRMTPGCNIDPTTGAEAAVPLPQRDISAYTSFTTDFKSTWTSILGHSSAVDPVNDFPRLAEAVSNAELNLCMAERMQEQLNSATVLFASDKDQLELLGYIRERAQLATLQYALLSKVLSAPGPTPTNVTNPHQLLGIFRAWAEQPGSPAKLAVMGSDFATAIRLDVDATNEFSQLLRREASARTHRGEFNSLADADWGDFSPRVRLLNLLYGGDPLTTTEVPNPGRGFGGVALRDLPFVEADMKSPEMGVLLGLAREADALNLKLALDPMQTGVATGVDIEATASRLYSTVEKGLQQKVCDVAGAASCPLGTTPPSNLDAYLLWTKHRVRLTHARALVTAFAEALGPSALGSTTDATATAGYGFGAAMFHLFGQHSTVQIDGGPWLHLDRRFDVRALAPQELAIRFEPGRFLPSEIDLNANAYEQGFITNRDALFDEPVQDGPGGRWSELRALGTVQALAFAREAILQGRAAGPAVSAFFNGNSTEAGAEPVLPLIEKTIGTSTVALRPDLRGVDKPASDCDSGGTVEYLGPSACRVLEQKRSGNKVFFNVDFLTTPTNPFTKLAAGDYQRDLESAALNADYQSFRGVARTDVDALPRLNATTVTYGSGDAARARRRFAVSKSLPAGTPGTSCNTYIQQLTNGDVKFSVTFPQSQFYVEVFSRTNGVQNVAQNIVSSQVANSDGTFTYSLVRTASHFHANDQVVTRFYSYRSGQPGVFTPGPAETVWSDVFAYGSSSCSSQTPPEVANDASIALLLAEDGSERTYAVLNELPRANYGGSFMGLGGSLNDIARDAWRVQPTNWSTSVLDAFNLPVDWVPPADASLVGGVTGQESYQYFLQSAEDAAEQATQAVQTAIQSVSSDEADVASLDTAARRSQEIGNLETRALCGKAQECDLPTASYHPAMFNSCAALTEGSSPRDFCETLDGRLIELVGSVTLPQIVIDQLGSAAPDFSQFAGGELERVLTAQWNAAKGLQFAVNNQLDSAFSFGQDIAAADAGLIAARTDKDAKVSQADAQASTLGGGADGLRAQIRVLLAGLQTISDKVDRQCCLNTQPAPCDFSPGLPVGPPPTLCSFCFDDQQNLCGLAAGFCAGYSFSGENGELHVVARVGDNSSQTDENGIEGKSWSPGPLYAAQQECDDMQLQLKEAQGTVGFQVIALNRQIQGADAGVDAALAAETAAKAGYDAAFATATGAQARAWSQFGAQLTVVQQAYAQLLSSVGELSSASQKKDMAVARADLDTDLQARGIEQRFGVKKKFQSYDLWRARALLESARRMAVAARRAIEARFVVDLSELNASQVFVEAPSVWADEIYGSDLNAPAAVGLSRTAPIDGAVFPNKLLDYVGNLRRFVQGYTVTYPTSVASPDTEVLSIPGPDLRITDEVNDTSIEHADPQSRGWQFACAQDGPWFGRPGAIEYPLVTKLAEACSGKPPAFARYSLSLDPWARVGGNIALSPLAERHNVRWRRLAVNLVGTGIRDCQAAADPLACYSDSFIRYDLKHAGPAWITNHAEQWRSYTVPTARIEAAKALATEEWLDPISNSWTVPIVANVARSELQGRPVGGAYDLVLSISPDVRLERIERVQLLVETDYWVRQD